MRFDLIIVGGGLVGAGFAAALAQSSLRIALIDASVPSNNDPRLFALNEGSCQFLKNMGVWDKLRDYATSISQVHVSRRGRFGAVRLHHQDVGLPALGNVIPAKYIEAALSERLATLPNITLYRPARLQQLTQDAHGATLHISTEDGEKILHTSLVIGADGTDSTVRKLLNIPADLNDYQQSALVTRTTLQRSHQHIAYERFVEDGAIAMLPLGENECATIWTADNQVITELTALSDHDFLQRLQTTFGYRLGRLQSIAQRHMFPLRLMKATKMTEGCVCLIGNAAHTLHPIAAQGFNLALYEVAMLVEGVLCILEQNRLPHALDMQMLCEKVMQQHSFSINTSHRLATVFNTESAWMSAAVQWGMVGLDIATPLKNKLLQKMMGRTGHVPPLLLSERDYTTNVGH